MDVNHGEWTDQLSDYLDDELSAGELQHRSVKLRTDFADELPTIFGDRLQLRQRRLP